MQAISAVDIALWDLKARAAGRPADRAVRPVRDSGAGLRIRRIHHPDRHQLAEQVDTWPAAGCTAMKIKIGEAWGADIDRDLDRVHQLRELAGPDVELMVDANGGYTPGQARRVGAPLDDLGVIWFEEPVSSDDTRPVSPPLRSRPDCDVAAGEYVADIYDAARLAPVVDCLQLDVTRCGGYTGWLPRRRPRRGPRPATSPGTAPPPCTPRSRPPSPTCATSNGSSTTPASNRSSSTGYPR